MKPRTLKRRLISLYQSAPLDAVSAGNDWYATARKQARALAKQHGTTLARAAGVIAALSPRVTWSNNLRLASAVLGKTYRRGAFKASLAKAVAIRDGGRPLKVLSGPKVRAFYRAIMGDHNAAVIDVWMLRALRWFKALKTKAYQALTAVIKAAAVAMGTTVAKLQAVIWTTVRGRAT